MICACVTRIMEIARGIYGPGAEVEIRGPHTLAALQVTKHRFRDPTTSRFLVRTTYTITHTHTHERIVRNERKKKTKNIENILYGNNNNNKKRTFPSPHPDRA